MWLMISGHCSGLNRWKKPELTATQRDGQEPLARLWFLIYRAFVMVKTPTQEEWHQIQFISFEVFFG
ncbi:hypothetical protein DJ84_17835 [Halorubrum ezzemoulense]|nr:hypothetical protein DJ84_17835 [Halorubrum ezzemoulense]